MYIAEKSLASGRIPITDDPEEIRAVDTNGDRMEEETWGSPDTLETREDFMK